MGVAVVAGVATLGAGLLAAFAGRPKTSGRLNGPRRPKPKVGGCGCGR